MWNSRDLALVFILAVTGFIYTLIVFQLGFLITGMPGSNYLFLIGQVIWITLAFLLFNGKRWRLSLSITIFGILTLPTAAMGVPFNIFPRIPLILNAIQSDIIMNTFYPSFKNSKKMVWFTIFFALEHFLVDGLLRIITYPYFYSYEYQLLFLGIFTMMLPVIIIESSFGAYIAYQLYLRITKPSTSNKVPKLEKNFKFRKHK